MSNRFGASRLSTVAVLLRVVADHCVSSGAVGAAMMASGCGDETAACALPLLLSLRVKDGPFEAGLPLPLLLDPCDCDILNLDERSCPWLLSCGDENAWIAGAEGLPLLLLLLLADPPGWLWPLRMKGVLATLPTRSLPYALMIRAVCIRTILFGTQADSGGEA